MTRNGAIPPLPPATTDRDVGHLRVLSILYYVAAGLTAALAALFIVYVVLGLAMLAGGPGGNGPPTWLGWAFVAFGAAGMGGGWTAAALIALAARRLAQQRRWRYCTVIASIGCLVVPIGTILGIFSLIVLLRPSVKRMFRAEALAA